MKLWLWLYLAVNILIFIKFYRQSKGVFQAPFLMAYTSIFVLAPQFLMIYNSYYYSNDVIPDLGFMMVSCNLALWLGYRYIIRKHKSKTDTNYNSVLMFSRVKWVVLVLTIMGFYSIFMWSDTYQGADNVIQANMKGCSHMALCLCIPALLSQVKQPKKLIYLLTAINIIPMVYFAFFVKGSRGETLFLVLVLGMYLAFKHPKRELFIRHSVVAILIFGAIASASIIAIRQILVGDISNKGKAVTELRLIDTYMESFAASSVINGMDLGNAALGIQYLKRTGQMDYGTDVWDNIVQNFVPRRVVGQSAKNSLKINLVDDANYQEQLTQSVTTMTGYYSAFRFLSYLGFIEFFLIGCLCAYFWKRHERSSFALFAYLMIVSNISLIFTHGVGYLTTQLFIIFVIIYPLTKYGYKRIKA